MNLSMSISGGFSIGDDMKALVLLFFIFALFLGKSSAENKKTAAIDKRFRLTDFARLKRVLRRSLPLVHQYALPRPPIIAVSAEDHSGSSDVRTSSSQEHRTSGELLIRRLSTTQRKEKMVKSGKFGKSRKKDVTRTTTSIPTTISSSRRYRNSTAQHAWSPVPYVIAGVSRPARGGRSEHSSASNEVVERSQSSFHTRNIGTTAVRRKILRMIVEKSLARKANASKPVGPPVVHVSGVYMDPNAVTVPSYSSKEQFRKKARPGYPRMPPGLRPPHIHSSHEQKVIIELPPPPISSVSSSKEESREVDDSFEPVFQVQPATQIHEDSNEVTSTASTLRKVEIQRPTTMIIHRKPPHSPPVYLGPSNEQSINEGHEEDEEDIEEPVTLSPYAKSKLLRYAQRVRKRKVRQDESIPAMFSQESLACRYCYIYWKRQDIQPRDIFGFCCRSKRRA